MSNLIPSPHEIKYPFKRICFQIIPNDEEGRFFFPCVWEVFFFIVFSLSSGFVVEERMLSGSLYGFGCSEPDDYASSGI